MATSSVNNNTMFTANSLYGVSSTGYKGIASGLDIDTIIDGMTAATRGKIAKQLQRKQIFQWRMDAYRSVSNKLIDFAKKYTSFTSSTNLMSNSFFSQNTITAKGSNSSSVTVTGSSSTAADLSILGIKKLATTASKSWAGVSDKVLATGEFDLAGETNQSLVAGSSITLKYGSSTVSLSLDSNKEYGTMEDVANALNAALKEEGMDTKIEFKAEGNKLSLLNKGDGNNTLEIKSGTESFMNLVGFKVGDKLEKTGDTLTGKEVAGLTQPVPTLDLLKGKKITFTYNGVTKSIQLPEDGTKINTGAGLAQTIQEKLDSAFGAGRINVAFEGTDAKGKLKITTTDDSSVVSMSYADDGVMGKNGVFGVANGESNRLNLDASIKESGFLQNCTPVDGEYKININETEIAFKETDTVKDFIDKINNSDAKVKVSYATTADVLTFVSTESGSSGQVNITDVAGDFAANVLGASNKSEKEGQDAVVTVSFNGTDTMDIVRNSNTFTMDGLNITLNSTFGYIKEKDGSGNETGNLVLDTTQEAITFSSKVDSDKILEAVKSMITDYNDMVDYINKELTTKPNNSSKSNYPPLTAEQKKEMSESEIQAWEEKAKAGMLFNDLDIRNLSNSLRFVLSSANSADLAKMGITTSTSYAENGKITLDEAKFKAALESDPESVKNVFLAEKTDSSLGGMMTQMKAITDKFASTTGSTKGILIEKAGSPSAPTSLLKNYLQTQMDDIDKIVDGLKTKLKSQVTRYNNQFTQLERLISQMNTQSEWLAQQFSY
ncbi:MAG: flagellar filament capping protein FliD [Epulopiscium sp.]|nr:flagellar filament capping protein FliD [Candidatus Epulonipiscium sp.]